MQKTPPENLPVGSQIVLAITPSRRAIGAVSADRLGLDRTWLLGLQGTRDHEKMIRKVRKWFAEILQQARPAVIVIERLSSRRETDVNQRLVHLIEKMAKVAGLPKVVFLERKTALKWLCIEQSTHSRYSKVTIRNAAHLLANHCVELQAHPAPTCVYRTDWDRTWGQLVAACAMALYTKEIDS